LQRVAFPCHGQSLSGKRYGRMGFIAVALVYFGGWRPVTIMAGRSFSAS